MKRLVFAALAILSAVAWSYGPPPRNYAPFVTIRNAETLGGTLDGHVTMFGCSMRPCDIRGTGSWKIATATGTIVVRGGFLAEPSP